MLPGAIGSVDTSTLIGLSRFLTNTSDNVNAFSDANIIALMNIEYRETQSFLLSQIMYDWRENTVNGTGTGLINLVSGTNAYAFPSGLLTLDRVEVNYTGDSNTWVEANPVKLESFGTAVSNTDGNAGIRYSNSRPGYWVRDGYVYLDPIPNQSITGGMKVWCTILATDLAIAGTAPTFATPFHQILAYGAAERYFMQKQQYSDASAVVAKKNLLRGDMVAFYSARQADTKPTIVPKSRIMR